MILRKKLLQALSILGMCSVIIVGGCASGEDSSSRLKEDAAQEEKADQEVLDPGGSEASDSGSLGEFSMEDVNGETYTQEMFADHDLTMINVFTTWCSPCIREIPDLEKLSKEMEDQGVQVVGIVLDVAGNADEASGREDGGGLSLPDTGCRLSERQACRYQCGAGDIFRGQRGQYRRRNVFRKPFF